jgi:hypothetical protein
MAADPSHKVLVVLGPDLMARSTAKAQRHGLSRSEYIRRLIEVDLGDMPSSPVVDPWAGQVTLEEALAAEPFVDPA